MSAGIRKSPSDNKIRIPNQSGVVYQIDGKTVSGEVTINKSTRVTAVPAKGFKFPKNARRNWQYTFVEDDADE